MIGADQREALRDAVQRTAALLDDGDHAGFLALLDPAFAYRVETAVPETAAANAWMVLDRAELERLFAEAPDHVWNIGARTRLVSVAAFAPAADGVAVASTFCIFRTDAEGRTAVQAVGRYEDVWRAAGAGWRLLRRLVRLQTRQLPHASPLPF